MDYDDGDEEEQRPLTTTDIRALLDEQEARINAKHKEEIRLQEERINAHQEEIRAHKEEMRLLEEATDKRFKDLEEASASSSPPPQDAADGTAGATQTNDETLPLTNNQGTSNSQLTPNHPRRRISAILSLFFFRRGRNEESDSDHDDEAGDDDNDRYEVLEEDTYSLLMLNNQVFREIPCCHPYLVKIIFIAGLLGIYVWFCLVLLGVIDVENVTLSLSPLAVFLVMFLGSLSSPLLLFFFTFGLQMILGIFIIADQTLFESAKLGCDHSGTCVPFHVPLGTNPGMVTVQYLVVFLAIATQNDIFSSVQTLGKLRNVDNVPWDVVIGQPGNRTWGLWICRILLPNVFKLIQGLGILFVTFILIIQTSRIVDLLKDFTALLVVSQADNIMFYIANQGIFGEDLKKKTEEVKAVRWVIVNDTREEGDADEDEDEKSHCWCSCCNMSSRVFFILAIVMMGGLTYFVDGQHSGKFLEMKYPECDVPYPRKIGNGGCNDMPPYNTFECGWDGGDCPEPTNVEGYINCTVSFPEKIGNGKCNDYPLYNTADCGWDGGDCPKPTNVEGYINCTVSRPEWIGNGWCHDWAPYNTPECDYDGGDCDPPP